MDTALDTILGRPVCASIYDALLGLLRDIGTFDVEAKKTSLHITYGRAFLGVHPRSSALLLNIVTKDPLSDARIRRTERDLVAGGGNIHGHFPRVGHALGHGA